MIDIPKLLPIVRKEFPNTPLPQLLKAMQAFSQAHPDLTNEQAVQAFQAAIQKTKQPTPNQPLFQGLVGKLPTGAQ